VISPVLLDDPLVLLASSPLSDPHAAKPVTMSVATAATAAPRRVCRVCFIICS